eukprot:scaffold442_cov397-Prasinococcus_capsulatus_cf.AAC.13
MHLRGRSSPLHPAATSAACAALALLAGWDEAAGAPIARTTLGRAAFWPAHACAARRARPALARGAQATRVCARMLASACAGLPSLPPSHPGRRRSAARDAQEVRLASLAAAAACAAASAAARAREAGGWGGRRQPSHVQLRAPARLRREGIRASRRRAGGRAHAISGKDIVRRPRHHHHHQQQQDGRADGRADGQAHRRAPRGGCMHRRHARVRACMHACERARRPVGRQAAAAAAAAAAADDDEDDALACCGGSMTPSPAGTEAQRPSVRRLRPSLVPRRATPHPAPGRPSRQKAGPPPPPRPLRAQKPPLWGPFGAETRRVPAVRLPLACGQAPGRVAHAFTRARGPYEEGGRAWERPSPQTPPQKHLRAPQKGAEGREKGAQPPRPAKPPGAPPPPRSKRPTPRRVGGWRGLGNRPRGCGPSGPDRPRVRAPTFSSRSAHNSLAPLFAPLGAAPSGVTGGKEPPGNSPRAWSLPRSRRAAGEKAGPAGGPSVHGRRKTPTGVEPWPRGDLGVRLLRGKLHPNMNKKQNPNINPHPNEMFSTHSLPPCRGPSSLGAGRGWVALRRPSSSRWSPPSSRAPAARRRSEGAAWLARDRRRGGRQTPAPWPPRRALRGASFPGPGADHPERHLPRSAGKPIAPPVLPLRQFGVLPREAPLLHLPWRHHRSSSGFARQGCPVEGAPAWSGGSRHDPCATAHRPPVPAGGGPIATPGGPHKVEAQRRLYLHLPGAPLHPVGTTGAPPGRALPDVAAKLLHVRRCEPGSNARFSHELPPRLAANRSARAQRPNTAWAGHLPAHMCEPLDGASWVDPGLLALRVLLANQTSGLDDGDGTPPPA